MPYDQLTDRKNTSLHYFRKRNHKWFKLERNEARAGKRSLGLNHLWHLKGQDKKNLPSAKDEVKRKCTYFLLDLFFVEAILGKSSMLLNSKLEGGTDLLIFFRCFDLPRFCSTTTDLIGEMPLMPISDWFKIDKLLLFLLNGFMGDELAYCKLWRADFPPFILVLLDDLIRFRSALRCSSFCLGEKYGLLPAF